MLIDQRNPIEVGDVVARPAEFMDDVAPRLDEQVEVVGLSVPNLETNTSTALIESINFEPSSQANPNIQKVLMIFLWRWILD